LKRLADEAVQIARVSPVHREYVATPGPFDYAEATGFAAATADVDLAARASALEAALTACRTAKVTGAGFHVARAAATAAATANGNRRFFRSSEGSFSLTARSADGTGSGYFAGDHFDLARLDVQRIAARAVDKAVRSQQPKSIEPGVYRTKDAAPSRPRTGRRASARHCSTSASISTAIRSTPTCRRRRAPTKAFPPPG
jgi:predicted Zn-dependent protease